MAECPSCGRSYQAPDSMAGKRVRCKQCQAVFQITAPPPAEGELDLEGLERSFSGGAFDEGDATATGGTAMAGTAMGGPSVDEHGRASIRRGGDVAALGVRGDHAVGGPLRTNLRFRYPFARQVDLGLPWLMVLLGLSVPLWLSLTRGASYDEHPSTGVGITRYVVMLLAFLAIVFPATHLAIAKAGEAARFNLPRTPLWRSLACAFGTMLLCGTLFILSGGTIGGLILGLIVGVGTTVALALLLFRTLPHEMSTVSAYAAAGAGGGAIVAAVLIFGINLAGSAIARTGSNPTLFESPIAVGAPWVERPVVVADKPKPKPPIATKPTPPAPVPDPTTTVAVVAPPVAGSRLIPLSVAQVIPNADEQKLVASIDQTPITGGFADLIVPLVPSPALGVLRNSENGLIECWDTSKWAIPTGMFGRNFTRNQPLFINTTGDRVVRLVTSPVLRIEPIRLESGSATPFVRFTNPDVNRRIEGFRGPSQLIVRARLSEGLAFEEYDLEKNGMLINPPVRPMSATPADNAGEPRAAQSDGPTPLGAPNKAGTVFPPLQIRDDAQSVKFMADGSLVVAGRDTRDPADRPDAATSTCIALYNLSDPSWPKVVRAVPWGDPTNFAPLAMCVNDAARTALLLDSGGEAYLTVWRLREETIDGNPVPATTEPVCEQRIGLTGTVRAARWHERAEPMIWLDQKTLLLYGRTLIDATTGNTLGTVTVPNVIGQFRLADGEVMLLIDSGGVTGLLRVRYNVDALRPK